MLQVSSGAAAACLIQAADSAAARLPSAPARLLAVGSGSADACGSTDRPAAQIVSMQKWVAMSRFEQSCKGGKEAARAGDPTRELAHRFLLASTPLPRSPAFIAVAS